MIGSLARGDVFLECLGGGVEIIDRVARGFVVVKFGAEKIFNSVAIDVVGQVKFYDVNLFVDVLRGRENLFRVGRIGISSRMKGADVAPLQNRFGAVATL